MDNFKQQDVIIYSLSSYIANTNSILKQKYSSIIIDMDIFLIYQINEKQLQLFCNTIDKLQKNSQIIIFHPHITHNSSMLTSVY